MPEKEADQFLSRERLASLREQISDWKIREMLKLARQTPSSGLSLDEIVLVSNATMGLLDVISDGGQGFQRSIPLRGTSSIAVVLDRSLEDIGERKAEYVRKLGDVTR